MQKQFINAARLILSWALLLSFHTVLKAQDEPDELTPRLAPYSELDTALEVNDCLPLTKVLSANVLNFQSKSQLYLIVSDKNALLRDNKIRFGQKGSNNYVELPFENKDGYLLVNLEPNKSYELLAPNTCEEWSLIQEISTIPKKLTEPIGVSHSLGDAVSKWKMTASNPNIFEYLNTFDDIPRIEKYEFYQNFIKDGGLLDDIYQNGDIPEPGFDPTPNSGERDCTCRVLNIAMTSEVYPTSSGQNDPTIHPAVFPNQIIRETNRIKFWHAGSFEGPARYQQIWGETKRCRNVTESASWGENSSDPLANALGRAVIRVEQVCKNGNWTPGDCYCTQNISFRYKYDAQLDARSNERGGWCLNPPGKKALALVDDAAMVLVAKRNDPLNPGSTQLIFSDVNAHGAASKCNKDFQEKRILDILKLGLAAYAYIKGVPIDIKNPTINAVSNAIWDEYQKSLFFSSLENLLTKPWVVGNCEQKTAYNTLDNTYSGTINGREALIFEMVAASHLEVNGMTAWDANARVLSGFSTSVVVEKNENVGQENSYCCTKPAGIYQTSTLHPIHGPNTYNQVIGAHFSPQLACCFPTSPVNGQVIISHDRNIMIGDAITNCETTINQRNSQQAQAFAEQLKVFFNGDALVIEGLDLDQNYTAELITVDGKVIRRADLSGSQPILFRGTIPAPNTGMYLLRLFDESISVTKKVIR